VHCTNFANRHFGRCEIGRRDREQPRIKRAAAAAPPFVLVTLIERAAERDSAIDIRLSRGHRLRIRAGCDPQLLEPRFSKEPSEDFRREVKQANETLPFKIHEPRATEGSPLIGGSSAVRKK
jgi:hypothetical protein